MKIIMDKNKLPKPSIKDMEEKLNSDELNSKERRRLKKDLFKAKVKNFLIPETNNKVN